MGKTRLSGLEAKLVGRTERARGSTGVPPATVT